jgi:hypothetical protein
VALAPQAPVPTPGAKLGRARPRRRAGDYPDAALTDRAARNRGSFELGRLPEKGVERNLAQRRADAGEHLVEPVQRDATPKGRGEAGLELLRRHHFTRRLAAEPPDQPAELAPDGRVGEKTDHRRCRG